MSGSTIYCGDNCNHTGPHRYPPPDTHYDYQPRGDVQADAEARGYQRGIEAARVAVQYVYQFEDEQKVRWILPSDAIAAIEALREKEDA